MFVDGGKRRRNVYDKKFPRMCFHGCVSGSDCDGCVYVFQWKIFVIIASHLTNFEKCGIKYVNI